MSVSHQVLSVRRRSKSRLDPLVWMFSLLIAVLRAATAANLYSQCRLQCSLTNPNPAVCICSRPAEITSVCLGNKTISQNSCESSCGEKGFRRGLVIRVGSCSRNIRTSLSFWRFFFFFLTRQMFTHNTVNKHASVSSLCAALPTNS